jgi:hypothetical protein
MKLSAIAMVKMVDRVAACFGTTRAGRHRQAPDSIRWKQKDGLIASFGLIPC